MVRALIAMATFLAPPLAGCEKILGLETPSLAPESGGGAGDGGGDVVGCADGTREAFRSQAAQPNIAGCSGAWQVPGVSGASATNPSCGHEAGNDGANALGVGCSVADLCASGWHVCEDAIAVANRASGGVCDPDTGLPGSIWITRQGQTGEGGGAAGLCGAQVVNNIVGCGTLGAVPDGSCAPLNRNMRFDDCAPANGWDCGAMAEQWREAEIVTKALPDHGGVLCCRTPPSATE